MATRKRIVGSAALVGVTASATYVGLHYFGAATVTADLMYGLWTGVILLALVLMDGD